MTARLSWLDFKLGFRMLAKYPGLTIVGGIAIAFAIWVGAGTFEFVSQVVYPRLPLAEGERIVGVRNWDAAGATVERRALYDFALWREHARSLDDLGAWRVVERNLIAPDVPLEPVSVTEMSASGFRVARVPAQLGRVIAAEDERPDAEPVVVIAHGTWQERFGGDPAIIGREIRLGETVHTVVGVMPEGFGFPVSQRIWAPLRLNPLEYAAREGPQLQFFGRLARGVTIKEAQAELTALGRRLAAEHPDTHAQLRPQVMPFAKSLYTLSPLESAAVMSVNLFVVLLLVLVCGNVALLMFARAATRENEIVVRNALGASRGRIIAQLFTEALVLAAIAAGVGLSATSFGLRWMLDSLGPELLGGGSFPFWIDEKLSPATLAYAALLTLFAAGIAGVVPALKVTRGLAARLRQQSAGAGGFRFGGVWTAVIVAQVAATVVFPVIAFATYEETQEQREENASFPAHEYLTLRPQLDRQSLIEHGADTSAAAFAALYARTLGELERRLEQDAAVAGVTFAERLPLMYHPHRRIELDEGPAAPPEEHFDYLRVSNARVQLDFFELFDAPLVAGRMLHSGDLVPDARAVVVNESFVHRILAGQNAVGRRLRYYHLEEWPEAQRAENPPWYEIVGVVKDAGVLRDEFDPKVARIFHAATPAVLYPVQMAVRLRGDADSYASRLRVLAADVDPGLQLHEVSRLDRINDPSLRLIRFWLTLIIGLTAVTLLISLSGIYSVMAFTVSQRTREIGVRVALGADARRIVGAIFRRPLTQVMLGIVTGAVIIAGMLALAQERVPPAKHFAVLAAYSLVMLGVCLLACVVPTRRALGIEPTEALRADG